MTFGTVVDGFPLVMLSLEGIAGSIPIEFIVDTGFDGDLSLPLEVVHRLGGETSLLFPEVNG